MLGGQVCYLPNKQESHHKQSSEIESISEATDIFLDALDEDLMKQTFEAAHQDYLAGRCKTHEQVMAEIRAKYA